MEKIRITWPRRPYKGLRRYSYADFPLFAGRESEVSECAQKLNESGVTLFLLHGHSGCGKSSFIEAGLIPHLNILADHSRLRPADPISALARSSFVLRSGRRPLTALARAVYMLIENVLLEKNDGQRGNDKYLVEARLGCQTSGEFLEKTRNDPMAMQDSLIALTLGVPEKLLIVIDQAENIFLSEEAEHRRYFNLLALLSAQPIDLTLMISLRGEFKARFDDGLADAAVNFSRVGNYYLDTISREGLLKSILHPTSPDNRNVLGQHLVAPLRHYKFSYTAGLAEIIREDLLHPVFSLDRSSILPVLQVICDRLYSHWEAKGKPRRGISEVDYRSTGACSAQVNSHLEEAIVRFFLDSRREVSVDFADLADRWRNILFNFVEVQSEPARAKAGVSTEEVYEFAESHGCTEVEAMLDWLSQDDQYILDQVTLDDEKTPGWKLVHDSIAAALYAAKRCHTADQAWLARRRAEPAVAAEHLSGNDLSSRRYAPITFWTINDLIWDHQIALYANHKGFAGRLGFEFRVEPRFDATKAVKKIDYKRFFETRPEAGGYRLAVLPSRLFPELLQAPWITVGIPNLYRGYAIIGRERNDLKPLSSEVPLQASERVSRLHRLAEILARRTTRIKTFEEESKHFVQHILRLNDLSCQSRINVAAPRGARYTSARDPMFTALVEGRVDFALGPAPSRALAEQAKFVVYADFSEVYEISSHATRRDLDKLAMHEAWVVDVPSQDRPVLLRLLALMLYTVDCIRANPDDFVRFLYNQAVAADGAYPLQREFMKSAISSCYTYASSAEYGFLYLNPASSSWYPYQTNNGPDPANIFAELLAYRAKCDHMLARMWETDSALSRVSSSEDYHRGLKHYQIYNYYDAYGHLTHAAGELPK